MADKTPEKLEKPTDKPTDAAKSAPSPQAKDITPPVRTKFRSLTEAHMPKDFAISMDNLRKGGADGFLLTKPTHATPQQMRGFDPEYVNIVDYIVRITHRIWEEKDIGYIYDTYSHDCTVWDDLHLTFGRDKVVADTITQSNAFPDLRVVADEVIWAGDDTVGFHSSHRTNIFGTNTGFSRFGAPTNKRVQFWCLANCVMLDNEIFHEHVVYDTVGLLQQMGFDPVEVARAQVEEGRALARDFAGADTARLIGQAKPEDRVIPSTADGNPEGFVRAALHTLWNRRNLKAVDQIYAESAFAQMTAGRVFRGHGQLRSFILSMMAMFPDLAHVIEDLYWMGNEADGYLVAVRWSMLGTHRGNGRYGPPTGKEAHIWGITHWMIEGGKVTKEWTMFNEFGLLVQLQEA